MRRKILMGVLALALPIGSVAVLSPAAFAKTTPNPVTCTGFTGTVTFGTPLSPAGVVTTASKGNPTLITGGSFTCHGGTAPNVGGAGHAGTITDTAGKNLKNSHYNKKSCKATPTDTTVCDKYTEGTWSSFTSAGGSLKKTLKSISFTIGGQAALFKTKGASLVLFGACGSDVGFKISGQVSSGAYADKTTASVTACLGSDAGPGASGNFGGDYSHANGVVSAGIDGAVSVATL